MHTVIDTGRLRLRAFTEDDLDAFHALGTDPEAIRYAGNAPFRSREHALEVLRNAPLRDYAERGFGRFACVWTATGEVIGFSGLKYIPEFGEIELGYRLLPAWWGQGLATEAGAASIHFARSGLGLTRLIAIIHPENAASRKVARKLGFAFERHEVYPFLGDAAAEIWSRSLA